MYINPFICGVIATILAELGAIAIAVVIGAGMAGKSRQKEEP